MTNELGLKIDYDVIGKKCCYRTNMTDDALKDIIGIYLSSQKGKGADLSDIPHNEDLFMVDLFWDLSSDSCYVWDNCNNKGLRDGILRYVLGKVK